MIRVTIYKYREDLVEDMQKTPFGAIWSWPSEVAKRYGVSRQAVMQALKEDRLDGFKIGSRWIILINHKRIGKEGK